MCRDLLILEVYRVLAHIHILFTNQRSNPPFAKSVQVFICGSSSATQDNSLLSFIVGKSFVINQKIWQSGGT